MTVHEDWLRQISLYKKKMLEENGVHIELPPPSLIELKSEFLEVVPNKKMVAKVPFQKRFTNPVGLFQGGFLAAALDDVFGPLSYISAERPCMTLSLNISYVRTFTEKMGYCVITAEVVQKSASIIFMRADVLSPDEKLIAHAETHVMIMRDDHLGKVRM